MSRFMTKDFTLTSPYGLYYNTSPEIYVYGEIYICRLEICAYGELLFVNVWDFPHGIIMGDKGVDDDEYRYDNGCGVFWTDASYEKKGTWLYAGVSV